MPNGETKTGVIQTLTGVATTDEEVKAIESTFGKMLADDAKAGSQTGIFVAGKSGEPQIVAHHILEAQPINKTHFVTVENPIGFIQGARDFAQALPSYRPTPHNIVITLVRWTIASVAATSMLIVNGVPPLAAGFVGVIGFAMFSAATQITTPILPWNQDKVSERAQWGLWLALEELFSECGRTAMVLMHHAYASAHLNVQGHMQAFEGALMGTASQGVMDKGTGRFFLNRRREFPFGPLDQHDTKKMFWAEVRRDIMTAMASAADVILLAGKNNGWHYANIGFGFYFLTAATYTGIAYFWSDTKSYFQESFDWKHPRFAGLSKKCEEFLELIRE